MKGADYVAVVRLTDRFGKVLAAPGKSCDRVPDASLDWLLRDGLIRVKDGRGLEVPAEDKGSEPAGSPRAVPRRKKE